MVTVYDFDGVIVDSFGVCLQVTQMYDPEMTAPEYRKLFVGNIFAAVDQRRIEKKTDPNFDYWANYMKLIFSIPPFSGIHDSLKANVPEKQVIVSSTTSGIIQQYLEQHALNQCFSQILGSDVEKSKKIKFERIKTSFPGEKLVFVTDTLGDILEASAVNIPSIAVTWGFHDEAMLSKGNPFAIVHTPAELTQKINSISQHDTKAL